jgi:hypothetical protein
MSVTPVLIVNKDMDLNTAGTPAGDDHRRIDAAAGRGHRLGGDRHRRQRLTS